MSYPLVLDLAADGIPVAVTCRALGFSKQAFYTWEGNPVSRRDWDEAHLINAAVDIHHDDRRSDTGSSPMNSLPWASGQREPGGPPVLPAADLVSVR